MSLFSDFIDLVFPNYCLMCSGSLVKNEEHICLHCRYHLPLTNYHKDRDNPLSRRFVGKVDVKYAWAFLKFTKGGQVQQALHHLKYNKKPEVGKLLGSWFGTELKKHNLHTEFDAIVPVPLHPSKLKKRGYNQCDPIADGLALQMEVAAQPTALRRNTANRTQTRLNRMERYENTRRIFEVTESDLIRGKRILLVDDVVTTGSTLEACVAALQEAQCRDVSIACIAAAQ